MNGSFGLLVASAGGIFLELLLIRYLGSEIPVLAYFKNFPLLAAFAGLGIGCLSAASGKRIRPLAGVALLAGLVLVVSRAGWFGWDQMAFPEPRIDVWGRSPLSGGAGVFLENSGRAAILLGLLGATAWSFAWIGRLIGAWIAAGPPLTRYAIDLGGSLIGVLAFTALAFARTPPAAWLLVAGVLFAILFVLSGAGRGRAFLAMALAALAALATVTRNREGAAEFVWSPYYKIECRRIAASVDPPVTFHEIRVNRDFHQLILNLSDDAGARLEAGTAGREWWRRWRLQYGLPYAFRPRPGSVLIGGAGSGNDAAAALRAGAARVRAVEIDPGILDLGRRLHPERPYASDRVRVEEADLRSYLRRTVERFDLIVYSVLDSHTALSALSSLRLDNYVYTVEGIRDALALLEPDGVMVLSFYEGERRWLGERLSETIRLAGGAPPAAAQIDGRVHFVFGPGLEFREAALTLESLGLVPVAYPRGRVKPAVDDWPFLYSHPDGQPWVYYLSLVLLVAATAGGVRWAAGPFRVDRPMFFLGAGFLLVETKALAELSLLFGSTWIVNAFVFSGVFVMAGLAVLGVRRAGSRLAAAATPLLLASLAVWYVVPRSALSALEFWPRAVTGSALSALPVFFAGLVFAARFRGAERPAAAFGSNLAGAVVGGAAEALSLAWGIRSLGLLAAAFYVLALVTDRR